MMNINKSTSSLSNPNISNGQTLTTNSFFLNQPSTSQSMKVMSNNNNTSNNMNQFGPSFTTTSNTTTSVPNTTSTTTSGIAASATSNSVAGLNQPQLPFHSQHSIFSGVVPSSNPASGISNITPLEDTNMNSNSGFDFLSMNPFSTNPNDPFQLGSSGAQSQGIVTNQTTSGLNQSQGGFGNRERRLSSIFDIENSRDSLDGGIGLFGSNNVFNATNKEDSCFSFGDHALSDKKNDIGEYDNSLFSFMEQRRYSKVGETTLPLNAVNANTLIPQKTDQFPLPPLSSPLLGNVNNNNNESEFKFPTRDILDESSKLSFASAGKSLTCTSSTSQPQAQRNLSFNELYTNPFNYDSLNTNNQTTMQKLLNMQQIILNNQERIHQNSFIDPNLMKQAQAVQQQQQQPQPTEQLVWNSIMNAQRTNERFLAENIFNAQFNQNAFLNKENPLLEKHVPLNTIAVQSHSLNNTPRSTDIGFMSHHPGYQFGSNSQKSIDIQKSTSQPAVVNTPSPSNSKNKKKRKAKEQASEKKKKIKSQGHSSESQLSNQEIILASSSQFEFDEKSQPKLVPEDSNAALLDNDSNDSSDSNQKKFCFRNLIVEKSSKKMKFVNSDIKEEGVNQGAWSEREHQAFLRGLKDLGYGKWREIADRYVKTRTRIQVASHSQKYHQRLERHAKKKKKLQKNTTNTQEQQSEEDMVLQHDTIHSEDE